MLLTQVDQAVPPAAAALHVVDFWKAAGLSRWFTKDPVFDEMFRDSFLGLHEQAARGELDHWAESPEGALALIILLDQFPRNAFRDSPRMYATDSHALKIAKMAAEAGLDTLVERELRLFMYMPFGHSEDIADHETGRPLVARLGAEFAVRAERYSSIVRTFGRFPHRNKILGRPSRSDEEKFLEEGGFSG
jgi:uncharacterized protein (DUF924 family)